MKTNKAIQLLRYWEMVFLLITGLMLTSIWASAETTNDVVSSDTRNSEAAANFDGKPDLEEAETRRYHRILALVEYSQGDRETALKHLRAAGALDNKLEEDEMMTFSLTALLLAEEEHDIPLPTEIRLKQAYYALLNAYPKEEALSFAQRRLKLINDSIVFVDQFQRLRVDEEGLNAMSEIHREEALFHLIAARCQGSLRPHCLALEAEVLKTWLKIHS